MSDPAQRPDGHILFRFCEERTLDELKQTERLLDVDGADYLRWLAGEGPDPCPPESSG